MLRETEEKKAENAPPDHLPYAQRLTAEGNAPGSLNFYCPTEG